MRWYWWVAIGGGSFLFWRLIEYLMEQSEVKKFEKLTGSKVNPAQFKILPLPPTAGARRKIMSKILKEYGGIIERAIEKARAKYPKAKEVLDREGYTLNDTVALIAGIIYNESKGVTRAIRFEPGYYKQYIEPTTSVWRKHPNANQPRVIAMSYGLMQVMAPTYLQEKYGSKAYTTPINAEELFDPNNNIEIGTQYLFSRIAVCDSVEGGIRAYNTGKCYPTTAGKVYQGKVLAYRTEARRLIV